MPKDVNSALLDSVIFRATQLERLKVGEVQQVVGFLDREVLPSILSKIERTVPRLPRNPRARQRRLTELATGISDTVKAGFGQVQAESRKRIVQLGMDEASWLVGQTRALMPINVDLATPPAGLISAALGSKGPGGPPLGRSWNQWWGGLKKSTQDGVMGQVRIGVSTGEGVDDIVRRVRGTKAGGFRDGVWQKSRRQTEAVVRTSVTHISAQARAETAKANEDVIKGERWVSTLDARTSTICASLDGKVFPLGEGIRPPAHIQCRSTIVPVLKSFREMGIDLDNPPPPTRAAKNYKDLKTALRGTVPGDETYGQWLKRQPTSIQDKVLGKGKARLFRAGRVDITRFTDPRNRPLTLKQLRGLDKTANKPN